MGAVAALAAARSARTFHASCSCAACCSCFSSSATVSLARDSCFAERHATGASVIAAAAAAGAATTAAAAFGCLRLARSFRSFDNFGIGDGGFGFGVAKGETKLFAGPAAATSADDATVTTGSSSETSSCHEEETPNTRAMHAQFL